MELKQMRVISPAIRERVLVAYISSVAMLISANEPALEGAKRNGRWQERRMSY